MYTYTTYSDSEGGQMTDLQEANGYEAIYIYIYICIIQYVYIYIYI